MKKTMLCLFAILNTYSLLSGTLTKIVFEQKREDLFTSKETIFDQSCSTKLPITNSKKAHCAKEELGKKVTIKRD